MTTDAQTKVYGTANPTLTGTVSGLQYGDSTHHGQLCDHRGAVQRRGRLPDHGDAYRQPVVELHGGQHGQHAVHHAGRADDQLGDAVGADLRDAAFQRAVGRERHGGCRRREPGSLSYAPASGAHLNAGTDTLTVTAAGTTDYSQATASVSLVVKQAQLTVTTDAQTKVYGTANPTLTGTVSGFQNGDSSITASYATTAGQFSDVGGYPITATLSGSRLSNYTVVNTGNTLSITQARRRSVGDPFGDHLRHAAFQRAVGRQRRGGHRRRSAGPMT